MTASIRSKNNYKRLLLKSELFIIRHFFTIIEHTTCVAQLSFLNIFWWLHHLTYTYIVIENSI